VQPAQKAEESMSPGIGDIGEAAKGSSLATDAAR
jgi:hypothetical protein